MSALRLRWPATTVVSLLAALTSWVSLWAWAGFAERPSGFLVPTLGAGLLVATTGMLLRSARVPALVVVMGQLAVLLLWLNRTWAPELSLGGWLPTPESVRELGARVMLGVEAAQGYPAPVPEEVPQIHALLIVAGAGTAVLVDFLACGLRRVPLAGLPLLAVYTAPVSILVDGVAWWKFAACAIAFLLLLAADEAGRLTQWGRQLSGSGVFDSRGAPVSTSAVRASARKIGLTATALAVVVPAVVPTLSEGLLDGFGNGPGGDGDSVAISNPIVDMKRNLSRGEDVDWIWVTTQAGDPSYLRVSVLDSFDGKTWKPSGRDIPVEQRASGRLPRPPGLGASVPREDASFDYEIGSEFESLWLPTPYPIAAVDVEGDWRYDLRTMDIISGEDGLDTRNLSYSVRGLDVRPTAEILASSGPAIEEIFTPNTELPDSVPDSVRSLARRVTDEHVTRFEKAVALQQWFREDGGFTYSLDRAPGNGIDDLEEFLGDGPTSRIGYCEQFAAAMAVMSRSIGIPARVAVGFLRPEPLGNDTYVYSSHDLHAWPELYFQGTGWVRFEPTPSDRAEDAPGYTSQRLPAPEPEEQESSRDPNQQQNRIDEETPGATPEDDETAAGAGGGRRDLAAGFVLGLLVMTVLAGPRLLRAARRRRRWARADAPQTVAEAAWSELRDSAIDLGLPWDDSVTLRTRARSLVTSFGSPDRDDEERLTRSAVTGPTADPAATDALERLVKFVERARYARSVEAPGDVQADVARCVQAMSRGASKQARFRATWLPESLVRDVSTGRLRRRSPVQGPVLSDPGVDHAV